MKRAVIITGHFPFQKRRGSILWVSHHLQKMGWHVTHVSVGYSWISSLKGDQRLKALGYKPKPRTHIYSETLTTIYGLSPLHPFKTGVRVIDKCLAGLQGLFKMYWQPKLRQPLIDADLVVCESGPPLFLAPLLSKYAPNAPRIYRVNDDIRLLNAPDYLIEAETKNQHHFTRISSANKALTQRFSNSFTTIDPMGIPFDQIGTERPSPYTKTGNQKIAVCAGTTQLDHKALSWIASARPNWQIHVLGRIKEAKPTQAPNLIYHGETPFDDVLGFVAHADIGLAPYIDKPGIEYQTSNSNRMLLYRHHGLPILGPDRICDPNIRNIIGYSDPNALDRCEIMPMSPETIQDWSALAIALTQNAEIVPLTDVSYVPAMSV